MKAFVPFFVVGAVASITTRSAADTQVIRDALQAIIDANAALKTATDNFVPTNIDDISNALFGLFSALVTGKTNVDATQPITEDEGLSLADLPLPLTQGTTATVDSTIAKHDAIANPPQCLGVFTRNALNELQGDAVAFSNSLFTKFPTLLQPIVTASNESISNDLQRAIAAFASGDGCGCEGVVCTSSTTTSTTTTSETTTSASETTTTGTDTTTTTGTDTTTTTGTDTTSTTGIYSTTTTGTGSTSVSEGWEGYGTATKTTSRSYPTGTEEDCTDDDTSPTGGNYVSPGGDDGNQEDCDDDTYPTGGSSATPTGGKNSGQGSYGTSKAPVTPIPTAGSGSSITGPYKTTNTIPIATYAGSAPVGTVVANAVLGLAVLAAFL